MRPGRPGKGGIIEAIALAHGHAGARRLLGEIDQRFRGEAHLAGNLDVQAKGQTVQRRDLVENATRPTLGSIGQSHTDGEHAARAKVHFGVRRGARRRTEPALDRLGRTPGLGKTLARGAAKAREISIGSGIAMVVLAVIGLSSLSRL